VIGFDPYARLADFLMQGSYRHEAPVQRQAVKRTPSQAGAAMRYGYWLPVLGGWLRNVENENMQASW
jgi:hypothetical protein